MIFGAFSWALDKVCGKDGMTWMFAFLAGFLWIVNGKLERKVHALEQQKTEAQQRIQTLEEAIHHAQHAMQKTTRIFKEQKKVERADHSDAVLYEWLRQQAAQSGHSK